MSGEMKVNAVLTADEMVSREALLLVLDGIKEKTPANWYDIDGNGRLVVVEPPRDCLSWIWEVLVRFFTGKFSLLETRIECITAQVEAYLTTEKDPAQLGDFCDKTSNAVNRLYETAAKLHAKQRISDEVFEHIQANERTSAFMLAPEDPVRTEEVQGRQFHPYAFFAHFSVENRLAGTQARFAFTEDEAGVSPHLEQGMEVGADPLEFSIRSKGNTRHLNALVLRQQTINIDGDYQIRISPQGVAAERHEVYLANREQMLVKLTNESGKEMFANLSQPLPRVIVLQANEKYLNDTREPVEFVAGQNSVVTLAPGDEYINATSGAQRILFKAARDFQVAPYSEVECFVQNPGNIDLTVAYQTETLPVNFGCKMGRYAFAVNEAGELVKRVTPQLGLKTHDAFEASIPVTRQDQEHSGYLPISNRTEHDVWAAVQVKETNVVENLFIRQGDLRMVSYDKILARALHGATLAQSKRFTERGIPVDVTLTEVESPRV